ncbi:MAG: acyl phosphate:glycerol-3-phosphate acyltransferase [Verrucomicrobiota bacterium]
MQSRLDQKRTMPWIEQLQSANWGQGSSIVLAAYVVGCFTAGYYLVRVCKGQDIREFGSGSVGAKNVGRMLGWMGFLVTVLCDIGKGGFVVWAARHFTTDDRVVVLAMLAVVVGHIWPVQLWFRGGKGMATSLGALLIYDYHLTAGFLVLFACAWGLLRKTVLPGLFAFACLPLVSMYLEQDHSRIAGVSALAGLVLITHRKNLMEEVWQLIERRDVHRN